MAQRFGGRYSPGSDPGTGEAPAPYEGAEVEPAGLRVNLLFLPPVALALTSLGGGAVGLVAGLAGAGLMAGGALMLREGLRAAAAYHARRVARRPVLPRKILAAMLYGAGVALAAWKGDPGLVAPVLFGGAVTILHLAAFGLDPLKNKGLENVDTFQHDRVARAVSEAESHLAEMRAAVARTGDRKLEARVERFQAAARELFRRVEEDPRDLTAARRYLGVYLLGARDAAVKYADLVRHRPNPGARADFVALLDDLEQNFARRSETLLLSDRTDLDVEIEVLRDRLRRDGLVAAPRDDTSSPPKGTT